MRPFSVPSTTAGAHAAVSADAIAHNAAFFVRATGVEVMAVVKADGYGLGAIPAARAALAGGATWLGVTTIAEALELRESGITAPVLSWLNPVHADIRAAVKAHVDLAIPSVAHLEHAVSAVAATDGSRRLRIHLHADTGMARDGASADQWRDLCRRAARAQHAGTVHVVGVMSHLSHADDSAHPVNTSAQARFTAAVLEAFRAGLRPQHRHLAATSAALTDAARHTMVRIGAGLAGVDLSGRSTAYLREAMTLSAPVVQVRDLAAGDTVGYGGLWTAPASTRVATVQVGYADGVPRGLDQRAEVSLHGSRCRVVGRVSMDQIVVDVTGIPVQPGDTAILWGGEGSNGGAPTIQEWAAWAGTIPHELLTGVGARVTRHITAAERTGR